LARYYETIDELPIWNWWQIADTGNLIYLKVEDDYKGEEYEPIQLWFDLQNEYLEEFGMTDQFRQILTLKKKWIQKKTEFLLTDDRFKLTEIDIIEAPIVTGKLF